jgi:integrase/recombinase XerD
MSDFISRGDIGSLIIAGPDTEIRRAMTRYLQDLYDTNYSPHTIRIRRKSLRTFARWLEERGVARPTDVTRKTLREHRTWMRADSGWGFSTQSRVLTTVRVFFRFLFREEELDIDPALPLDLPRVPRALPTGVLSREEVQRILEQPGLYMAWGLRDRAAMEVLFATGIRRAELIHLHLDDIDYERRLLTVRRGKVGRGRVVPISDRALAWVQRYLKVRPEGVGTDSDFLSLTSKGAHLGSTTITGNIRKYVVAAGIEKAGSTHMFRATTATMMLEGGADLKYIQEMLGHANIETTQVYTRVSVSSLQRIYNNTHPSAVTEPQPQYQLPTPVTEPTP